MLSRRQFFHNTSLVSSLLLFAPSTALAALKEHQLKKIGFISSIVGKELKGDWKTVLKQTVEYGFSELEVGGFFGDSAESFLRYCKKIGLTPVAGGIPFSTDKDIVLKGLEKLDALNIKHAITYWPWLKSAPFNLDDCRKSVEIMNAIGEVCNQNGFIYSWHNHNNEFIPMEEGIPFDYLMKHTDKNTVSCELDVYWVAKGGSEPLAVLKKYKGRINILHLKDMTADEKQDFECVGKGIIDFPKILREALNQDIRHFFVEFDKTDDGMACLKTSSQYLLELSF